MLDLGLWLGISVILTSEMKVPIMELVLTMMVMALVLMMVMVMVMMMVLVIMLALWLESSGILTSRGRRVCVRTRCWSSRGCQPRTFSLSN